MKSDEEILSMDDGPWIDFLNIRAVQAVLRQNGSIAIMARSPKGWIFNLVLLQQHFSAEGEVERIVAALNQGLAEGVRLHLEGWELVGVDPETPAAAYSKNVNDLSVIEFEWATLLDIQVRHKLPDEIPQ